MTTEVTTEQLDEAYDRVYRGRTIAEFTCREHGHFESAFTPNGNCVHEAADHELQQILKDQ